LYVPNCEAQLCKMIYLSFLFVLKKTKLCLKLDPCYQWLQQQAAQIWSVSQKIWQSYATWRPHVPLIILNTSSQRTSQFTIKHWKINFHMAHTNKSEP